MRSSAWGSGFTLLLLVLVMLGFPAPVAARSMDWQQRVNYEIDVTLSDDTREMAGFARVEYVNNSPDTLSTIWFRLAPAALRGGSVRDTTWMRGHIHAYSRLDSSHWGNCRVGEVRADSRSVRFVQDHSVGRLIVDPPLHLGDTVRATLPFTTRFPTGGAQSRIGHTHGQVKGAYWYPQVCAYTPEQGWTVNHYFGTGEAYGEFGDYTIRYTVPYKFIIASTGELVNEAEVLPPERLAGLALDNPDPIPVPTGEEAERLVTWVFQANDVPDVAFTMDPLYLIDRIEYDGFEAWAFVRRDQTEDWDDCAEVCGWTIEQLEEIYGDYPWPRVQASYSWSGMEYPMLTMASWTSPLYRYFIMHEVIHNYTPMILHSNSTDEQWIDEGMTTFIEHELSARWYGSRIDRYRTYEDGLFERSFWERDDVVRGARPYLEAVLPGEDLPMDRASDTALDYPLLRASSYYKGPVLFNALRGVVGEDRFWQGFRIFYDRHKLTHVGYQDILTSFQDAAGRELDWLFEQMVYGSGDIDYAITGFDRERTADGWRVSVDVERKGEVRLPVRLGVRTAAGDTVRGEVAFLATDPPLPGYSRWASWDQMHRPDTRFTVQALLPANQEPVGALLDPDGRYLDRNPLDNQNGWRAVDIEFDPVLAPVSPPPVDRFRVLLGPAAGYDVNSGLSAGLTARGSFMEREGVILADLLAAPTAEEDIVTRHGAYSTPMVQGRLGLAHPLNRTFGPTYGTVYGGVMHDDRWAELGLWRSWRAWATAFDRATWMVRGGFWRRDGLEVARVVEWGLPDPDLNARSWTNDQRDAFYIHARVDVEGGIGGWPYLGSLRFTQGVDDAFTVTELELSGSRRIVAKLDFGVDTRAVALHRQPPHRFAPTLRGGASYRALGHPIAGGAWERRDGIEPGDPAVLVPAMFAAPFGGMDTDRFGAVQLHQTLPLGRLLPRGHDINPFTRAVRHLSVGLYEGAALFRDPTGDEIDNVTSALEVGGEFTVSDLYGLTLSVRYPIRWKLGGESWTAPNSDTPLEDRIVTSLRVDLDRYFRN